MDDPIMGGITYAGYFVKKAIAAGKPLSDILQQLIRGSDGQSIFRKEQTFFAVCLLYLCENNADVKDAATAFLDKHKDAELPLLSQVECRALRLIRKLYVLDQYPKIREYIARALEFAPELNKFVERHSALTLTFTAEIQLHDRIFQYLKLQPDSELEKALRFLLAMEAAIEKDFRVARSSLSDSEREIGGGFATYGEGGKHYFFRGVLHNYGIEGRPDLTPASQ